MTTETVTKTCPYCNTVEEHTYPKMGLELYRDGMSVQLALPKETAFAREFLITGACFDCISRIFNKPKPGEDWGEIICECECCGAPIYEKDDMKCPSCGTSMK